MTRRPFSNSEFLSSESGYGSTMIHSHQYGKNRSRIGSRIRQFCRLQSSSSSSTNFSSRPVTRVVRSGCTRFQTRLAFSYSQPANKNSGPFLICASASFTSFLPSLQCPSVRRIPPVGVTETSPLTDCCECRCRNRGTSRSGLRPFQYQCVWRGRGGRQSMDGQTRNP